MIPSHHDDDNDVQDLRIEILCISTLSDVFYLQDHDFHSSLNFFMSANLAGNNNNDNNDLA